MFPHCFPTLRKMGNVTQSYKTQALYSSVFVCTRMRKASWRKRRRVQRSLRCTTRLTSKFIRWRWWLENRENHRIYSSSYMVVCRAISNLLMGESYILYLVNHLKRLYARATKRICNALLYHELINRFMHISSLFYRDNNEVGVKCYL